MTETEDVQCDLSVQSLFFFAYALFVSTFEILTIMIQQWKLQNVRNFQRREHCFSCSFTDCVSPPTIFFFLGPQSTSFRCKNIFIIFLCSCAISPITSSFQKTPRSISSFSSLLLAFWFMLSICLLQSVLYVTRTFYGSFHSV